MTDIDSILKERGSRYGEFTGHAQITQDLKRVMTSTSNWSKLTDYQKEALEMIVHKIGRILNGDPTYQDSWDDIAGYAKLGYIEKKESNESEKQCSSEHTLYVTKNGIIVNASHNSDSDPIKSEYYPITGDKLALYYNGLSPVHFTIRRVSTVANIVSMMKVEDGFECIVEYAFGVLEGLKLISRGNV